MTWTVLGALAIVCACGDPGAEGGTTEDESTESTGDGDGDPTGDGDPSGDGDGDPSGDGDGDPGVDACPLSEAARTLLEEHVADLALDVAWMTAHGPVDQEGVFAFSLPGTSAGHIASALLFMPCTGPEQYIGYCEPSSELPGISVCSRLGCEDAGVRICESWFSAASAIDPADATAIDYAAQNVAGDVAYAEAPLRAWRLELVGDALSMTSTWTHELSVDAVDFGHSGDISIEMSADTVVSEAITQEFPGVALDGAPVTLTIEGDADSSSGAIMHEGATLATIDHAAPSPVTWLDPCAEP